MVADLVSATTYGVSTLAQEWAVSLNENDSYHYQEWDGTKGWGKMKLIAYSHEKIRKNATRRRRFLLRSLLANGRQHVQLEHITRLASLLVEMKPNPNLQRRLTS